MNEDEVLRKVKKLLRVSEPKSGATSGEVENAIKLIDKLMRDHNLSMLDVSADHDNEIGVVCKEHDTIRTNFKWHKFLALAMGELCECRVLTRPHPRFSGTIFAFIGTKHDTEIAKIMFNEFVQIINIGARVHYSMPTDRRSYADGFSLTLLQRCKQAAAYKKTQSDIVKASGVPESEQDIESRALVLVDKKQKAIEKHVEEKMKVRPTECVEPSKKQTRAFLSGCQDGRSADLTLKDKEKGRLL